MYMHSQHCGITRTYTQRHTHRVLVGQDHDTILGVGVTRAHCEAELLADKTDERVDPETQAVGINCQERRVVVALVVALEDGRTSEADDVAAHD